MTTNLKICGCGDCEAAVSRAMKMCEQMFNDNECAMFQAAVAGAFSLMASLAMEKTIRSQAKEDQVPSSIVEAALGRSVAFNMNVIDEMACEHAKSRRAEIEGKMKQWWDAFTARLKADHEAQKADSPNIGKPKI